MNAWFGDARALVDAVKPSLDTVTKRSLASLRALEEDPATALPAALVLATSLPVALLVGVPTGGLGVGVALGLLIATAVALRARVAARRNAQALAEAIADAQADANHRVMLVTKQYEWAVNDVANLRDALRRARAEAQARASSAPQAVPLARRLSDTDPSTTLRFAAQGIVPDQLRILNDGTVVAISARALESPSGGNAAFTIRMGDHIAAALTAGEPGFAIEALMDERWLPVELRPADVFEASTTETRDKRGRVYSRPSIEERPFAIIALPLAQTS